MSTVQGRCHCGAVEFDVKMEDKSHILCHCDACKRLGGSDFTLNQLVPLDALSVNKGRLTEYTYEGDSGDPVHCFFCTTCSTHIYHHQASQKDHHVIRTATLDGSKEWPVSVQIYCKDKAKWQPDVASKTFPAGPA